MTRSTVERRRKLAFSSALCFSSDSAPSSAACAHRLRRTFQRPYRLRHRRQGRLRLLQLPLQQHPLPHPLLRRLPCRLRHRRQGQLQLHPKRQRTSPLVSRLQHQQQRRALNPRVLPLLLPQVHRAYRLPPHPRRLRQQDTLLCRQLGHQRRRRRHHQHVPQRPLQRARQPHQQHARRRCLMACSSACQSTEQAK